MQLVPPKPELDISNVFFMVLFQAIISSPGIQSDPTGIILIAAATGMLRNPMATLANHCCLVRGMVFAKVPRNSMMMIWKRIVQLITPTNT